jgi:hypothetical protein
MCQAKQVLGVEIRGVVPASWSPGCGARGTGSPTSRVSTRARRRSPEPPARILEASGGDSLVASGRGVLRLPPRRRPRRNPNLGVPHPRPHHSRSHNRSRSSAALKSQTLSTDAPLIPFGHWRGQVGPGHRPPAQGAAESGRRRALFSKSRDLFDDLYASPADGSSASSSTASPVSHPVHRLMVSTR